MRQVVHLASNVVDAPFVIGREQKREESKVPVRSVALGKPGTVHTDHTA